MKIIEGREGEGPGISEAELREVTGIVRGNILQQFKLFVQATKDDESFVYPGKDKLISFYGGAFEAPMWTSEVGRVIQEAWSDPNVKRYVAEKDFITSDGLIFLLDGLNRIAQENYVPTEQDLLRIRVRTVGYVQAVFKHKNIEFEVADCGGQRAERRHWLTILQDVTSVLFCAPLSEFDQMLREDKTRPRMTETSLIFEEMTTYTLQKIPIILLLNKVDIFKEKLHAGKSIRTYFADYKGPDTWEASAEHIRNFYLRKAPDNAEIYTYFTTAVDTQNIETIWKATREIILNRIVTSSKGLNNMYGISMM